MPCLAAHLNFALDLMRSSTPAIQILFFLFSNSSAFAEECLLNQEYFQSEAKSLASRHVGAIYYDEERLVRWDSKDLGRVSVIVGGCENFGLKTISERRVASPSSRDAILAVAKRLARVGWPKPYGREAETVLSGKPHAVNPESSGVIFEYDVSGYTEFTVSQSFVGGVEKISIAAEHLQ
jgi:hypothetical protein